jgi:hypothetical protein
MGFKRARGIRLAHIRVYRKRERERMQSERPPGRFSISAGFVSVRVTAVHRRDFHAPTVSQQADYTSGQQPRRSSPAPVIRAGRLTWPRLPPREARDRNGPPSKAFLRTPEAPVLNLGISRVRSDNSDYLEYISRSIVSRGGIPLVNRGISANTTARRLESASYLKNLSRHVKSPRQDANTYGETRGGGEDGEGGWGGGKEGGNPGGGSSGQSGPETKIPFVDSSPSEPKD